MNKFTKKQILIGALILLFVINIAALGTIIYQNYQHKWDQSSFPVERPGWSERDQDDRSKRRREKDDWPGRQDSLGKRGRQQEFHGFQNFIKRRLELDSKQFRKFQTLHKENMESMKGIARELGRKRDTLMKELTRENPDSAKMDRLAGEIGDLHTQLKKNTINHFTKMKKLCRPDQKEELKRMIMEMSDHGRPEAGPGAGMRQGNRPNKRMNRR